MTETVANRMVEIADGLLSRTRTGQQDWEQVRPADYRTTVGANLVVIASQDGDGSHPSVLKVQTLDGADIEALRTGSAGLDTLGFPVRAGWEQTLEALYTEARRQALHVDETLDELLGALRQQ